MVEASGRPWVSMTTTRSPNSAEPSKDIPAVDDVPALGARDFGGVGGGPGGDDD